MDGQIHIARQVFLSYAHVNERFARKIVQHLDGNGFEVMWDGKIEYGEELHVAITNAISSANLIIGLISPQSLKSEWVMWELSQAFETGIIVVPVLVDGAVPENLPPPFDLVKSVTALDVDDPVQLQDFSNFLTRLLDANKLATRRSTRSHQEPFRRIAERRLASAAMEARQHTKSMRWKNHENANSNVSFHGAALNTSAAINKPLAKVSPDFAPILNQHSISLIIASSQSGQVISIGARSRNKLSIHAQHFDRPMSVFGHQNRLFVAEYSCITELQSDVRSNKVISDFSHTYRPTTSRYTGALDVHTVAVSDQDSIWIVATKFNCLATLTQAYSFQFEWKPDCICEIVPEDHCHLNGLAMDHGKPAFASLIGGGDYIGHWRECLVGSGQVYCVQTNSLVCDGLSMPHSPKVSSEKLWVLNSGTGEFGWIDRSKPTNSAFKAIVALPGFARGLSICNGLAFIGLSKPRYDSFEGLPLGDRLKKSGEEPICGVYVVDISTGRAIASIIFENPVLEISDLVILEGIKLPKIIGTAGSEMEQHITISK